MREHVAVKTWSERVQDEGDQTALGAVVERVGRGWRRFTARRGDQAAGLPTSYLAHYIQCRCGRVFMSRQPATAKALLRGHQAQNRAEKNARSGFDAAAARKEGHAHGSDMGG